MHFQNALEFTAFTVPCSISFPLVDNYILDRTASIAPMSNPRNMRHLQAEVSYLHPISLSFLNSFFHGLSDPHRISVTVKPPSVFVCFRVVLHLIYRRTTFLFPPHPSRPAIDSHPIISYFFDLLSFHLRKRFCTL